LAVTQNKKINAKDAKDAKGAKDAKDANLCVSCVSCASCVIIFCFIKFIRMLNPFNGIDMEQHALIEMYLADEAKCYEDWYTALTQTEGSQYAQKVRAIPPMISKNCA